MDAWSRYRRKMHQKRGDPWSEGDEKSSNASWFEFTLLQNLQKLRNWEAEYQGNRQHSCGTSECIYDLHSERQSAYWLPSKLPALLFVVRSERSRSFRQQIGPLP
jgi:hypothetical protein